MTYNPYQASTLDNYEGAKFSSWIVTFDSKSINYNSSGIGSVTKPLQNSNIRIPVNNAIETLKDPFGDGISKDSSDSTKLNLPPGKYWLDLRIGMYNGARSYNHYYGFSLGIAGYLPTDSGTLKERWIGRGAVSYLEEQVRGYSRRNIYGYYESTNNNCYIRCYTSRGWISWAPGGTPTVSQGSSSFGTGTNFPFGNSRLLVMRLE